MKNENVIKHKFGFLFPPILLVFGLFFILVTMQNPIWHKTMIKLVILPIGFGMVLTRHGLLVDHEKLRFRNYITILGVHLSPWKSYQHYPYVAIVCDRKKMSFAGRSNLSFKEVSEIYKVVLLSGNHLAKVELFSSDEMGDAKSRMNEFAISMDLQRTIYDPKLSKRTLEKRMR
jgi:hypothetical protein